jgi:hypothetical protein
MEIGELLVNLGFKADTTKLRDFITDIGDLNMSSIIAASGLGGILDGIKNIMEAANKTSLALNNFHALTGLSSQELQAWDLAAQKAGLSSGLMATTVNALQDRIENLKRTGEGGAFFAAFGIDPTKTNDTFSVMKAIGDKLAGMSIAEQKWMLSKFGLPEELVQIIPMLDKIDMSHVSSSKSLALMKDFWVQIHQTTYDFGILINDIGAMLEKSFVGNLLKGLDALVKFLDHAQVLYPLLNAIEGVMAVMAVRMLVIAGAAIVAALANPLTSPWAIAAMTAGVGMGVLGAMQGQTDNSRDITMHNYNTFHGDTAENNMKAYDEWYQQKLQTASDQNPHENF